jgi:branched-chain amino acid transport system substrate-binding protein
MTFNRIGAIAMAAWGLMAGGVLAQSSDTVKIAYIEPLSGFMANVGESGAKNFRFIIDQVNAKGGVLGGKKLELVTFDNKLSPQESLVALKAATDQGIHYVTQGQGSSVAGALIDAINKHNERNPKNRVLFLNYAAVDPDFTNDKCSFWHFRFDANSDMKMEALTNMMKDDKGIKKVYLINQDYSFGHQVAKAAKEMIGKKMPGVQIVGEDLHPLARTKDFSPYVAKIKASGADTVITGNWGNDMSLLVKASRDSGLDVNFWTYYGGGLGTPGAIGEGGVGRIKQVSEWHNNVTNADMENFYDAYKKKYADPKDEWIFYRARVAVEMLAKAMNQTRSADPLKVAYALEGMKYNGALDEVVMRKEDHQLVQPLYISTMQKKGTSGVPRDVEGSDFGFRTDRLIAAKDTALPTTCKMQRPAQ